MAHKQKQKEEKTKYYTGFFLLDSGLKINIAADSNDVGGDSFAALADAEFPFDDDDTVWTGELLIRAKKIVGWLISEE